MTKYKMTKRAHPLRPPCGKAYLHRVLLYDEIGPGFHPCHHCGVKVEWRTGESTEQGSLIVDHLDGDVTNNALTNLVPSCQPCNMARGTRQVKDDEAFIVKDGKRHRATRKTCRTCGKDFLIITANIRKPGDGRYCSMECVYKRSAIRTVP